MQVRELTAPFWSLDTFYRNFWKGIQPDILCGRFKMPLVAQYRGKQDF